MLVEAIRKEKGWCRDLHKGKLQTNYIDKNVIKWCTYGIETEFAMQKLNQ